MLIVEGPDLVGKTTFCHLLLKRLNKEFQLGHVYAHLSRLPEGFDGYHDHMALASTRLVQDRFHMSEIVYGLTLRGKSLVLPETYRMLDGMLRQFATLTVVIVADHYLLRDRYCTSDRAEMFTEEQVLAVNDGFHKVGLQQFFRGTYSEGAGTPAVLDYFPDVDYVIRCTPDKPYPTEEDAIEVVNSYLERFYEVTNRSRRNGR